MSIHAAIQFGMEYSEIHRDWFEKSNYLCWLSVDTEEDLISLAKKALILGIECSIYKEPDIDNQVAAIALAANKISKKLCNNLKLALKEISQKENKMTLIK